jgi:hypothetical protein
MIFPELQGSNLHRQKITLPADLQGELNILFIPFYQWHQNLVDAWVPLARQLEMELPGVAYYELPVIRSMNILSRTFINEGMRAGIPDPISRERTITLYLDKDAFRSMLDMPDEETIYILVVDREGNVVWRAQGAYSEEKGAQLTGALREMLYVKAGYEK